MSILVLGKLTYSSCGEQKKNSQSHSLNYVCWGEIFFPLLTSSPYFILVLPIISKMEKHNGLSVNYFNLNQSSVVLGFLTRRVEIIDFSLCYKD